MNPANSAIVQWIQAVVPTVNLFMILFGIIKVFNRHEHEWQDKERRLVILEQDVNSLRTVVVAVTAIQTKLNDMESQISTEIGRVRDRLDKFLDARDS